jgi:hypothetical protein
MTRSILLSAILVLASAASTQAAVTYNGHRVRAVLVGGIDAAPCTDPEGCVRGVVELRFHHRHHDHLVRCGHPKRLHVVGTFPFGGERWANVFACSRHYFWRLP